MAHTDLFNLVKSLTASEKRYFTKWHKGISSREGNQQLLLLNALYKMENYSNTELVKPRLRDRKFKRIIKCF